MGRPLWIGELWDIFEGGYLCMHKKPVFDDVLARNIKELLVRERIVNENVNVIIPACASGYISPEGDFYEYYFEVYDEDGNTMLYRGIAYGQSIDPPESNDPCDHYIEILDLTVELYKAED